VVTSYDYTVHCLLLLAGKSKEAEVKRINKELANIRSKFKGNVFPVIKSKVFKSFPEP